MIQPARKVMIVIEDDGSDRFKLYMAGDIERLNEPAMLTEPTPAEFWGMKFFKACHEVLKNDVEAKKLNREERRREK